MSIHIIKALSLVPDGQGVVYGANSPIIAWNNLVTFGGVTAEFELDNYPVVNASNESTALEWRSSTAANQTIEVSVPTDVPVEAVGLAAHNLGTAGTVIGVEASDGEGGWEPVGGGVMLADDGPALLVFPPVTTETIRIVLNNSDVAPRIAVLFVGPLLRLPRNIYVGHTPINLGRVTETSTGESEAGDFFGRIILRRLLRTSIQMLNIPPLWYRDVFHRFVLHSEEGAFFFAWRPGNYPQEVGYVWTTDNVAMVNQLPNGFVQFSINVQGIAK